MPPICVTIIQLYGGNRAIYGSNVVTFVYREKDCAQEAVSPMMHIFIYIKRAAGRSQVMGGYDAVTHIE
jgi:hypothetical protein